MPQSQQREGRLANYVEVKDRVKMFYAKYPAGRIITCIVEHDRESGFIFMQASVYRYMSDDVPAATGHAFEIKTEGYVNKTSYIENCETSAVGRALAFINLGIEHAIASAEEMQKVEEMSVAPDPELVKEITRVWLSGNGATEVGLGAWVKKNNGGIELNELPATRQQEILNQLLTAKKNREAKAAQ